MKQIIGKVIWTIAESFNISLGRLAPVIFEWMIGAKGRRQVSGGVQDED